MPRVVQIETPIHGRVLVEDAAVSPSRGVLVTFHGYAESAADVLAQVRQIPAAAAWTCVAPQALHRFYDRRHERVMASWMTREDRDLAIADNLMYLSRVLGAVDASAPLVYLGFSQGASMAYRTAILGGRAASGVVAIAGDIPPEVKAASGARWPPVLVAAGTRDEWFNARVAADVTFLRSIGAAHDVVRYDAAHEWTDELRHAIGTWLARASGDR